MENLQNTLKQINTLVKDHLAKGIDYKEYRDQVAKHTDEGTSSGPQQSEALSQYTLLNNSRMKRLDKTLKISEEVINITKEFHGNQTWLVLTESWCGDAAHALPVMQKLTELNKGIDLKVVYRDENEELMDAFLTNGSKSIPKLIVFDHDKNEVVEDWGPRPNFLKQKIDAFKETHGTLTPEFKQDLQVWYNKNKGQEIAQDLIQLLT